MHIKPSPAPRAPITIRKTTPQPTDAPEIRDRISLSPNSFQPSTGRGGIWKGLALTGVFVAGALAGGVATTITQQPTESSCHCPEKESSKGLAGEGEWSHPDDWKEELGGNARQQETRRQKPSKRSRPSQKKSTPPRQRGLAGEGEWNHPDEWKEELGGGSSSYDDYEDSDPGDSYYDGRGLSGEGDWGGPDDWKSGL